MNQNEIKQHERYKQMALYSYDVNKNQLPPGAKLVGIAQKENGYYAAVIRDRNNIVIAIRGTEGQLLKSKENIRDAINDATMWPLKKKPAQTNNALETVNIVKDMIKNDSEYAGCKITVVGHSLGGSLAQIVAVIKGIKAVTFNAFGTKNLLKDEPGLKNADVTNYCNPNDDITTLNAQNHVGRCYEVDTVFHEGKGPHNLECMGPLENRVPTTGEDLKIKGARKRHENPLMTYVLAYACRFVCNIQVQVFHDVFYHLSFLNLHLLSVLDFLMNPCTPSYEDLYLHNKLYLLHNIDQHDFAL